MEAGSLVCQVALVVQRSGPVCNATSFSDIPHTLHPHARLPACPALSARLQVVGKFAEKRDPSLACVAYKRGQCDEALVECTAKNAMFKLQARTGRRAQGACSKECMRGARRR